MRRHFELVKQRQKRVGKYGQLNDALGANSLSKNSQNTAGNAYAMFSGQKFSTGETSVESSLPFQVPGGATELRRRGTGAGPSSARPLMVPHRDGAPIAQEEEDANQKSHAQKLRQMATNRLSNAEAVEATVAKVPLARECLDYLSQFCFRT